jgi:hypothetical protein
MIRLIKQRQIDMCEIDQLDLKLAVALRLLERPLGHGRPLSILARARDDDLKTQHLE